MIFSNLFKSNKKDTFILPLGGDENAIKKYPLNDFENNFFYGFKSNYPQYYSHLRFQRMSTGNIKFSYDLYPIGGVTRKGSLFVETDYRYKNPYKFFDDPFNHYDDIVTCIKRKIKD